jgi:hypothetical protein
MSEQSKPEHYQLVAQAVAGLNKNTGEGRRVIYDCMRTTLIAQLHSVNPPLSDADITRERLTFEATIRKVEAESLRRALRAPLTAFRLA